MAHANVAAAAMARHRTQNIVAGLGYFLSITQLRDHYHPITAKATVLFDWTTFSLQI